ncbi:DJ-1/PfpI family protein [Metabacillus iocasae]|uniref:Transcriptional regulator GlxA family with amidase domain n=1 Tax=Priestia iocasae TaxID=2291674 RepID=A0ABS2QW12_9BACI|nr:DJ-1/PfpI family protein [Metabacillus iocasae]MBM7703676.1 transcriptional regulator GlxA family with amidase domain [Metabacillus iocasae]
MNATGVFLYPRFSEYEISVLLSVLQQSKKTIITIGLDDSKLRGEAGLTCVPDTTIANINLENIDSLVLPGVDDFAHLVHCEALYTFLQKTSKYNLTYGAISSAPYFLAKSGLLNEYQYTTGLTKEQRAFLNVFNEHNYQSKPVVQDQKIITARGSAFIDFALLFGKALNLSFNEKWYK